MFTITAHSIVASTEEEIEWRCVKNSMIAHSSLTLFSQHGSAAISRINKLISTSSPLRSIDIQLNFCVGFKKVAEQVVSMLPD